MKKCLGIYEGRRWKTTKQKQKGEGRREILITLKSVNIITAIKLSNTRI